MAAPKRASVLSSLVVGLRLGKCGVFSIVSVVRCTGGLHSAISELVSAPGLITIALGCVSGGAGRWLVHLPLSLGRALLRLLISGPVLAPGGRFPANT